MALEKDEVKQWLKEVGQDRFWLAQKCHVDKRTVDKWFESRGEIPARAILIIQDLIGNPEGRKDALLKITVEFTENEMGVLRRFQRQYPEIDIAKYLHDKALEFGIGMAGEHLSVKSHPSRKSPSVDARKRDDDIITGIGPADIQDAG